MLPFDSKTVVRKLRDAAFARFIVPGSWWVPCYTSVFTGNSDDTGRYIPDPDDLDYDGPVYWVFDIFTTPYLA